MRSIALAISLTLSGAAVAAAQTAPSAPTPFGGDAALTYRWERSNTQPTDCGCFNLNGGAISASIHLSTRWSAVAEVSGESANDGPGTGSSLTLMSYLAGARYRLPQPWTRSSHAVVPFAQVLAGATHAGGGIAGAGDGTFAFEGRIGGGIDMPLKSGFALRLLEADYDATTFANGANDRQNNLLLGAGVVFRWARNQ
jgi:outer membrane immunogenic protein